MRIRASLVVGLFASAFTVAAGIPVPAAASAPSSVKAAAPNHVQSVRTSMATPHQVDVSRLPAAAKGSQSSARLPLLVRDPAAYAAAKASPKGRAGRAMIPMPGGRSSGGVRTAAALPANFPGITSATDAAAQGFLAEPPDTQMAAGNTRVLEMVNDTGQVYDKTTHATVGSEFVLSSFFLFSYFSQFFPTPNETVTPSDPRVLYDSSTGRWYATILGYNPSNFDSGVFLAISTTGDPGALWNVYLIDIETNLLCDQPKLGYSSDKFVVACSDFNTGSMFQSGVVIVTNKAEGLAGAGMHEAGIFPPPNNSLFGMVPTQNLSAGNTAYVVMNQNPSPAAVGLMTITGDAFHSSVVFAGPVSIAMAITMPPPAPQNGGTGPIDTGDGRFNSAVVQGGVLTTSGGEGCTPAGDSAIRACIRTVQIGLAGNTVIQSSTTGILGTYVVDPTLGLNASNDIVMGYSTSSATTFPDFEVAIQPAGDVNFYETAVLTAGTGPYESNVTPTGRWGDYGAASVDPGISAYVWVAGEFSNGPNPGSPPPGGTSWGTQIAELNGHIPSVCTANTLTPVPGSPSGPSTSITITAAATCVSGASPDFQFWIKPPNGPLAMVQNYGGGPAFTWTNHVTLGTYTLEVLVRATNETRLWDSFLTTQYAITATPCTTPTLMANPSSSPQIAGTAVLLTATTTCGTTPLYQFWVQTPDMVLHQVQDYSPTNTYNWNSLNTQIGNYLLYVLVKNTGSLGSYDAYKTLPYSMQLCTTPTLSTGTATSPYTSGSGAITLTASATCAGGTQYEFWYQDPAGAFHLIGGGYGAGNTAPWSADFKAGSYNLLVEVRPVGSTANFVTYKFLAFTLTGCGVPTLAPDKTSPQVAGTLVTWTATVTCSGTPNYKFYVQSPAGVFTVGQDWGSSATFPWTSPATAGTYHVQVWVRNAGAVNDLYDNYTTAAFTLGLCDTPTLNTGAATSPYASGAGAITLTASANCAGGTQYEFWYQDPAGAFHLIGSGYGAGNTAPWSADFKAGSYNLLVEVRPVGSTANFVTYKFLPFTLTGCGVPTLTPDKGSPQAHGTLITWTAVATCSGTGNYKFYVQSPVGVFTLARDWNATNTFPWTPTTPGTYHVQVWVRNAGAVNDLYDNFTTMTFTIT